MIVVVGGQARKVGKTRAVCDIIAATREARWLAVKVSSHSHEASDRETDTDRYLAAGAESAVLAEEVPELPAGRNVILESNAAVEVVAADLFVFVAEAGAEWKESARRVVDRADVVVESRVTAEVVARVRGMLSE